MANRALLLIDVQNEYFTGNLPISYPPVAESLRNIESAAAAAERAGIPVVVVAQVAPAGSPIFADGGHGQQLHESIAARRRDLLIHKKMPSAFTGTGLAAWLTERGVDTVVIAGYMTQNCDESTAREAVHLGYQVEFLADATGTLAMANQAGAVTAEQLHQSVLVVLQSRFAAVASTAEWIAAVESGGELARSNVAASAASARTA
ncbi:MAG: cysteine hydrolase [Actinomycetia bacterium]|nr:cysteine hydrolase [Actinomycetes bacterium]